MSQPAEEHEMIDCQAVQVIEAHMQEWDTAHPDATYVEWLNERHDYIMSLAVSLWADANEEQRTTARAFADRMRAMRARVGASTP